MKNITPEEAVSKRCWTNVGLGCIADRCMAWKQNEIWSTEKQQYIPGRTGFCSALPK